MPAPKPTRRSHVVPRFLIAKFAYPHGQHRGHLNVLLQGRVTEHVSPENVGVDNRFYASVGMFPNAEHVLASEEDILAGAFKHWQLGRLEGDHAKTASRLALHLLMRGHAARVTFCRLQTSLAQDALRGFSEEIVTRRSGRTLEHALAGRVFSAMRQSVAPSRSELAQALRTALAEELPSHVAAWHCQTVSRFARQMTEDPAASCLGPAAHTHVVCMMIVNQMTRDSALNRLHWAIHAVHDEPLLIGDCGPLVRAKKSSRLSGMTIETLSPALVVLPIGSDRLLVGAHSPHVRIPTASVVNRATIEVSRQFVAGGWSKSLSITRLSKRCPRSHSNLVNGLILSRFDASPPWSKWTRCGHCTKS